MLTHSAQTMRSNFIHKNFDGQIVCCYLALKKSNQGKFHAFRHLNRFIDQRTNRYKNNALDLIGNIAESPDFH